MASEADISPERVDARGMRCPWPVLRAARAMRDHDLLLVLADDPQARDELEMLAKERGWTFAATAEGFRLAR